MPQAPGIATRNHTFGWRAWAVIMAGLLGITWVGWLQALDLLWLDARFALRRHYLSQATVPEIVLIAADEDSLQVLTEPMALWHRPLALVFDRLAQLQPRAVGVDLALPERSYEDLLPGGDAVLAQSLARLRGATALVLAIGADGDAGRAVTPHPLFLAAAGWQNNGLAHFARDPDGTVRRFSESLGARGETLPTLAGQLARHLNVAVGPGLIDFSRGPAFEYLPLHELTRQEWHHDSELARRLAGKIVLLGAALPYLDRHMAPARLAAWESRVDIPGLVLQAQALRSLLGKHLIHPTPGWVLALLSLLASASLILRLRPGRLVAFHGLLAGGLLATSLLALDLGWDVPVAAPLWVLAGALATQLYGHYQAQSAARARLLATFGGFVSPAVLDALLEEKLDPTLPLRRHMVFLFADLRDFSGLSQRLASEQVFGLLNRYYAAIAPALHAHGATIDNFRGDGLMAFFGAPQELLEPEVAALGAARAAWSAMATLNRQLASEGLPELRVGISLACGEGVAGKVGDVQRNNYTALADAANVAAHLQGLARKFDYAILATEEIATLQPAAWVALGNWQIKDGRQIAVYGLDGTQMQNTP